MGAILTKKIRKSGFRSHFDDKSRKSMHLGANLTKNDQKKNMRPIFTKNGQWLY